MLGTTSIITLAGCSLRPSNDTRTPTNSSPTKENPTSPDNVDGSTNSSPTEKNRTTSDNQSQSERNHRDYLLSYLSNLDIEIRELRVDYDTKIVVFQYVTAMSKYDELSEEIGGIAGGFLREVDEGWNMKQMNASILDTTGNTLATWFVKSEWHSQYQDGSISAEELSLKILKTLERVD
jgi:hypothetical protein